MVGIISQSRVYSKFTKILIVLAAFGTIGGALFGFDIRLVDSIPGMTSESLANLFSSMSAWIGTDQYLNYFNSPGSTLQGGVSQINYS